MTNFIDRLGQVVVLAGQGFVFAWREMFKECRATITGRRPDGEPESRFCDNGCGYRLPHEYAKHETTCGACLDEVISGLPDLSDEELAEIDPNCSLSEEEIIELGDAIYDWNKEDNM